MSFSAIDHYKGFVFNNFIKKDDNQISLLKHLTNAWDEFNKNQLFSLNKKKIGIYVFGSVGTGKTFLLDLFVQYSKVGKKIHFNHLMNEIHNSINVEENKEKKIESFIKKLSQNIKILFIDELHIFNIVDALIIKKVFYYLEQNKIFIITTSNFNPKELYKDGLQRDDFIPFIDHLKQNYEIFSMQSKKDYRRLTLNQSKTYFTPINKETKNEFNLLFERLVDSQTLTSKIIKTNSRKIEFTKCTANVAFCSFEFICNANLGYEDYNNVAKEFNLIFIENVPKMNTNYLDQCRRFISLIDMLYENNCSIVILATKPISTLSTIKSLNAEFKRTASRLYEMTIVKPD